MRWYHYLAAVFAGFCFANALPHGVAGMMGETFPSPFGDPPGVGHSSALINVLWALANLAVGYVSLRFSDAAFENMGSMISIFFGISIAAVMCSLSFSGVINW